MIGHYYVMFVHMIGHYITFCCVMIGHIADIVTYVPAARAVVADSLLLIIRINQAGVGVMTTKKALNAFKLKSVEFIVCHMT